LSEEKTKMIAAGQHDAILNERAHGVKGDSVVGIIQQGGIESCFGQYLAGVMAQFPQQRGNFRQDADTQHSFGKSWRGWQLCTVAPRLVSLHRSF
jgi:hypothetical protein